MQALLDMIAINIWFDFDFTALMPNDAKFTVLHLLSIIIVGIVISRIIFRQSLKIKYPSIIINLAVTIFFIWALIAISINDAGGGSIGNIIYASRVYALNSFFFIVGTQMLTTKRLHRFGMIFLFCSIPVGIISMTQTITNGEIFPSENTTSYLGIFQPLANEVIEREQLREQEAGFVNATRTISFGGQRFYRAPGSFAGSVLLLVSSCLIAFVFLTSNRSANQLFLGSCIIFSILGVLCQFGRTNIAVLFLFMSIVVVIRFKYFFSSNIIMYGIFVSTACVLLTLKYSDVVVPVIMANIDSFVGEKGADEIGSLNGRTQMWSYVLQSIVEHPIFGNGEPITYAAVGWGDSNNSQIDLTAHNMFLEVAYRIGVVPFLLLFFITYSTLKQLIRLSVNHKTGKMGNAFYLAIFVGFICMILMNQMTTKVIFTPQIAAFFWIIVGLCANVQTKPILKITSKFQREV